MSRLLLLCAWRTTREIALILGNTVCKLPAILEESSTNNLLDKDEIISIGIHLQDLLFEAKHRGAFEQTYIGFYKFCSYLWTTENLHLNSIPTEWIKNVINLIGEHPKLSTKSICATRRGAGIPFIIQAIVVTEIKCKSTHTCLHYCMQNLLKICLCSVKSIECRTHALNIMRILFRCANLREAIAEFLSDGVIAAISVFASSNWMEKNAAALLFAALMTRIFGNDRKNDFDTDWKISGQLFFTRYPKLYQFVLGELEIVAHTLKLNHQMTDKLHLLLLLLKRFCLFGIEANGTSQLPQLVSYVLENYTFPKLQIRILAARILSEFVNEHQAESIIIYKCKKITVSTLRYKIKIVNLFYFCLFYSH